MYTEQYNQLNRQCVDWKTEEEVRLGWLTILQNTLAITFHAERGRSDADYNQVIILWAQKGRRRIFNSATAPVMHFYFYL